MQQPCVYYVAQESGIDMSFGFFLMLLPVMAIFLNLSTEEVAISGKEHKHHKHKHLIKSYNCLRARQPSGGDWC